MAPLIIITLTADNAITNKMMLGIMYNPHENPILNAKLLSQRLDTYHVIGHASMLAKIRSLIN